MLPKLGIFNLHLLVRAVQAGMGSFDTDQRPLVWRSGMGNVHVTWRCMCELDTVHIHVMPIPNHVVELAICNLNLLLRAAQAGVDVFDPELPQSSGLEVVDEQCAWYVEVCV